MTLSSKKVLFLESYSAAVYGAQKSMLSLAHGLQHKMNMDVVISTSREGKLSKRCKELDLECHIYPIPSKAMRSRKDLSIIEKFYLPILVFFAWFKNVSLLQSMRESDSICVNDIRSFLYYLPFLYINKKKVIWYVRINDRIKFITGLAARLSYKILLISSDCKGSFTEQELSKYRGKFEVLHTGFEFHTTQNEISKTHSNNDTVFITVGSICRRKNTLAVIEAFNRIELKDKFLYVLGSPTSQEDEKYLEEVEAFVEKACITSQVCFISSTPFVDQYLAFSDYFLFASHKEGLPRVLIEALLNNCYVISSRVDGVTDIIKNDNLGLYTNSRAIEPNFKNEFDELIKKALVHEEKSDSRCFVKESFSYNAFLDGFYSFLK
ncbi:glycosyltransferase [Salinivibrio kushneri]|uniref:Glycosyltransferase n=1 Tax=Salinivibrio kushneri TaxID=1908198 RepID=A0AA47KJN9_9GAMM|nr:glycosyltransferase [Salinivibrio kushneri]WBA07857.1 glycosyltransferase [Salinivibrio kushneri]